MKKVRRWSERNSFLKRLVAISLVPGLGILLILSCVFFPMMRSVAQENDEAYEAVLERSLVDAFDRVEQSAGRMVQRLESSDWLYYLFIDQCVRAQPHTNEQRKEIPVALNLALSQEGYSGQFSFRFHRAPNTLYTNSMVIVNSAWHQEMYPQALMYYFFDGPDGFSSVEFHNQSFLLYCAPFRDAPGCSYKGRVNLLISSNRIWRELYEASDGHMVSFSLLDGEGQVLWTRENTGAPRQETVLLRTASRSGHYQFEIAIPRTLHERTVSRVSPAVMVAVAVCALLCAALAVCLALVGYRPVKTIVAKYAPHAPESGNEFDTLDQAIGRILQERNEVKETLSAAQLLAQQTLLGGLLSGKAAFVRSALAHNKMEDPHFPYGKFAVIACAVPFSQGSVESPSHFAMNILDRTSQEDMDMATYLYCDDADHYRVIVNFEDQAVLDAYVKNLFDVCMEYFPGSLSACFGVGGTVHSEQHIYRASEQAENAMNYAALGGSEPIVYFRQIEGNIVNRYFYPFSMELLLSKAIQEANEQTALELLEDVIQSNREQGIHSGSVKLLYADMFSTIFRSLQGYGISLAGRFYRSDSPTALEALRDQLDQLIRYACLQVQERISVSDHQDLEQRIMSYIDAHLLDQDLSLSHVADHFGRSSSFVSSLFKRNKETNFNDYVNRARIKQAVEFFVSEQRPMKEISEAVGYISETTFRRNFIKYTKQSPSEFEAREKR